MQLGEAIQRLKSEEALRKSEEKYRAITENIPVTLYSALPDEHSTNLFVTRRLEELTGYPAKSFLDNPKLWVNIIHPEDKDRVWQAIEKHRQQRNQLEIEYRIVMPDQSIKWVRDKATPALDAEGVITRIDGFMEDITEQKKAEEDRERLLKKVRAGQRHLQALSRRLAEVQELERRNLVRKLHDEVGQNMTALSINLNIINSQLPVESSEKISFRVNDSMKLIEETVGRIRDVMAELRPPVLDDYGLMATLNWYSKQFSERTGIATVTEGDDLVPRLPSATETAFYRIAQEALTNVAKHAKAKQVSITLKTIDGKVSLTIIDDGIGFDHEAQQSDWGFLNMKERAQAIGGELIIESAPGRGTKVIAEVPRN
jgi:two-component system sensor histidine kinase UhpB